MRKHTWPAPLKSVTSLATLCMANRELVVESGSESEGEWEDVEEGKSTVLEVHTNVCDLRTCRRAQGRSGDCGAY